MWSPAAKGTLSAVKLNQSSNFREGVKNKRSPPYYTVNKISRVWLVNDELMHEKVIESNTEFPWKRSDRVITELYIINKTFINLVRDFVASLTLIMDNWVADINMSFPQSIGNRSIKLFFLAI